MVRKTQFPRLVIPLSTVLTGAFNLCLNLVVVFVFILALGVDPTWTWLLFPLAPGPRSCFTAAVSMALSVLYVRFRDVAIIWVVLAQVLFYATPILYPIEALDNETYEQLLMVNPLAPIFEQVRVWVLRTGRPDRGRGGRRRGSACCRRRRSSSASASSRSGSSTARRRGSPRICRTPEVGSAQEANLNPEPGNLGQLPVSGHDQIHIEVGLGGGKDQRVRHAQRLEARPQISSLVGNGDIDGQDRGEQAGKEPGDVVLVVMSQASAGHHLGIGDGRCHQSLSADQFPDRLVGGIVESILPIEKADDDAGVEDYRHSSRSPSTRSRN